MFSSKIITRESPEKVTSEKQYEEMMFVLLEASILLHLLVSSNDWSFNLIMSIDFVDLIMIMEEVEELGNGYSYENRPWRDG